MIEKSCEWLHKEGQEVFLVGNGGPVAERIATLGVKTLDVGRWPCRPSDTVRLAWKLAKVYKSFRPDIVHVHGRSPAIASRLAGRTPDFFTMHNSMLTERAGLLDHGWIRNAFSVFGKQVIVLNRRAIRYLNTQFGIDEGDMILVANGVDCDEFHAPSPSERRAARAQFGMGDGETMALFVGRLHPQKQPAHLVGLAREIRRQKLSGIRIMVVGEGELFDPLSEMIAADNLNDICVLKGWMDPKTAYHAADLLLMPSLYEGSSVVASESLACGLPVLMTPTGNYEDIILEGFNGFVTRSCSEGHFVCKAVEILAAPGQISCMRGQTREWASTHLSLKFLIRRTLGFYRESLGIQAPTESGV